MNRKQLNDYFESVSPTESQKERMKKALFSDEENIESSSIRPKGWGLSKLAFAAAGVVLALIVIGSLSNVGNTQAGISNWLQDHIQTVLDGMDEERESELFSREFSIEKHKKYSERAQDRGLTKEQAEEGAFFHQLGEVAIVNRAFDLGITVSEGEALQSYEQQMAVLKETLEDENVEVDMEAYDRIKKEVGELGIADDKFWKEHGLSIHALFILEKKLEEYEKNKHPEKDINERKTEIIMEYMSSESQKIAKFKREIGLE